MKSITQGILVTLLLTALTACSSKPTHIIVSPVLNSVVGHNYNEKTVQFNVVDMRTSSPVVQILKVGKAATILSSQQLLEKIIADTLTRGWKKQQLFFAPLAAEKINIIITKAVIQVNQKTIRYTTQSEIILRVEITNAKQTLTTHFTIKGNSKGPLQADIAVLEREFNQQLSELLEKILASDDIKVFLN